MPQKIIIIGATSGIGREMALQYLKKDYLVAITGRRNELLQEIKQLYPNQVFTRCFDVTDTNLQQHISVLIDKMKGLDLLIYNAGFGEPTTDLNPEIEINTTRTNVSGMVEIVPFVYNYFVQQGFGQIALISSVAAVRGNSCAPAYSASKAFLSIYAESLNLKATKQNKDIVVTDVRPGFIDTKMAKGNKRFWVATTAKAATQIIKAISKKKRIAYVTRRWRLVAAIMRLLPFGWYKQFS